MKRLIIAVLLALVPVTALATSFGTPFLAAVFKAQDACKKPYRGLKHPTQSEKNTIAACIHHAINDLMEKHEPKSVAKVGGNQQQQRPANAIPCSKPGINTYMRRNFDNWAQDSDRSYRYVHTMPVLTVSGGPHTIVCEAWIMEKVPYTGVWYKNLATIWVHHKPGTNMDYTRVSGLN